MGSATKTNSNGQLTQGASSITPFDGMENTRALPRHTREHNRSLVVRVLYHNGPMSRAEIARTTGLAKVTISDLIAQLIEAGYVEELGLQEVTGPGKPAILVDLARKSQLVLAVDLSDYHVFRGALLDLDAEVVHRINLDRDGKSGDEAVDLLCALISQLIEATDKPILGIGIGTPGIVNAEGTVVLAQNLDWKDLPLQAILAERFDIPVVVDNDANLAAMGEHLHGEAPNDFVLITIGHGIGAGIMLGGSLIRGTNDSSGEIGLVMVGTEDGFDSPYNFDYTLEHWLSLRALEAHWYGKNAEEREQILRNAGRLLGVNLAALVAALDLSEIVIAGPPEVANDTLASVTAEVINRRTLPGYYPDLVVRVSSRSEDLVFLGCSALALSKFLGVS
ncbi:MAG: ROK family transcriptional regulator [Scrofimicrobium sp.]